MYFQIRQAVPVRSELVDISSTDHTFTDRIHAIRSNEAGDVVATLSGDSAARTYTVAAGEVLVGEFSAVSNSGTTVTTAGALVGLVFPIE